MDRILRRDAQTRKGDRLRGVAAEDLAARFLERQGLRILERNYRMRGGEIDLICGDGAGVIFVEVRLRGSAEFGGAAASITLAKQGRLILAARHWLARHGDRPCRFDCVLLRRLDETGIEWLKNAITAD